MESSEFNEYEISVKSVQHGTIVATRDKAGQGDYITIRVNPCLGYQLHPGSLVYYVADEAIALKEDGDCWGFEMPGASVHINVAFDQVSPAKDFIFNAQSGEIVGYHGLGGAVVIPEKIRGERVKRIKDFAFFHQNDILSMVLPHGIKSIGKDAFSNCFNLTWIVIPQTVTAIEEYAFAHCVRLESINLLGALVTLGKDAFRGCNVFIKNKATDKVQEYSEKCNFIK